MTSMLVSDKLSMDRINPYTLTGTFGTPNDGMYKTPIEPGYTTQISETPMEEPTELFSPAHFSALRVNMSGAMMAKTGTTNFAPYAMFPARKYQYIDGTTSWERPELGYMKKTLYRGTPVRDNTTVIVLFLALVAAVFASSRT